MVKKILSGLILVSILALPVAVSAQFGGADIDAPGWGEIDVMEVLDRIVDWLFAILLVVAAIFIIIAGYNFVTAYGDADKVKKARDFVLYALVGVLVGFGARGLIMLVEMIVRG